MVHRNYHVHLTTQTVQHLVASTVQLHADHLAFVNSMGRLTPQFLKDLVRSWNVLTNIEPAIQGSGAARVPSQFLNLVVL
jgi:hypothetical protein